MNPLTLKQFCEHFYANSELSNTEKCVMFSDEILEILYKFYCKADAERRAYIEKNRVCEVCGNKLDVMEILHSGSNKFIYCCSDHYAYEHVYQPAVLREQLGMQGPFGNFSPNFKWWE